MAAKKEVVVTVHIIRKGQPSVEKLVECMKNWAKEKPASAA